VEVHVGPDVGLDGQLSTDQQDTLIACVRGIVPIPLVVRWKYVFNHFMKAPGDPWRTPMITNIPEQHAPSLAPAITSSGP
jgi:hypothetical protein